MAKISRRAVASSSSSSSASVSSASSSSASSKSTTNANNIAYGGKPIRSNTATELSSKYVDSIHSTTANALPDPLRGSSGNLSYQFTTTTTGSNEHILSTASPSPPDVQFKDTQAILAEAERRRIRAEFFATYDVMTGVRIAATLSGFFGLMVFLIVWKSRSSSNETLKVLKDPKMAAVAAVCMQEEEEREIHEAMVATGMSIYPDEYDAIAYRRQRMLSLGNVSAPPMLNRGFRFSSVGGGGYSSLLEPPRRFSYSAASGGGGGSLSGGRRKSGSESSRVLSNYPMGSSFGNDDYFMETEDEMESGGEYPPSGGQHLEELNDRHKRTDSTRSNRGFLEVPLMGQDSRRSSAMTCCSTESSYLERRCSAFTLGLANLPPSLQRKLSTVSRTSSTDNWDYFYPDIQVIQPTPKPSPCPSERSIYEQLKTQVNAKPVSITAATLKPHATPPIATTTTMSKTAKQNTAANGESTGLIEPHTFVRKHSIAYYDPESAQGGRKQEIHSISADTVDMYPYNQFNQALSEYSGLSRGLVKPTAPNTASIHHAFQFSDSPTEELHLNVRHKIAVVELQHMSQTEQTAPPSYFGGAGSGSGVAYEHNNNSFPYTNSAVAVAAAAATTAATNAATANSSSISIDSTPVSIDKLNGSGSLGTISAKALFNVEKRAPLASLSSFKISSLEYQDSEMRSLDDDSVFLDSVADTDEDMQQLSSGSEEASLDEHDSNFAHESAILVGAQSGQEATATTTARVNQPLKYPSEKRFSLGAPQVNCGPSTSRARKPLLQRHRTISVSSNDRVSLLTGAGQQLKEFHYSGGDGGTLTPTAQLGSFIPLETHFGSVICTNNNSPPTHPRRAQLLQQYSDPQSLPTNTTEDDTCSTLNTEVCAGIGGSGDASAGGGGGGGAGSTSLTQYSSLNTVISFGRSSPLSDTNFPSCSTSIPATTAAATTTPTNSQAQTKLQQKHQQQLPRTILADDPCASSISDSIINTRHPIICMPSSLKNLIIRGSATAAAATTAAAAAAIPPVSKSATNLSLLDGDVDASISACRSVMLELPLIKLPTDESSESSSASEDAGQRSRTKSDESHDPSLPGTSRKWSKETLF